MSFHQETALAAGGNLVVFPSNHELTIRAHGMAPTTLRRHLAALVEAGLIIRRDSPNGKRYARKGQGGAIEQAFGFDFAPLVARAAEKETLAEEVRAQRGADALMREQITLLRRDTAKSIEAGLTEGIPAPWAEYATQLMGLSQACYACSTLPSCPRGSTHCASCTAQSPTRWKTSLNPTKRTSMSSRMDGTIRIQTQTLSVLNPLPEKAEA